jgi:AcrR family transcriptional regulator
VSQKGKKNASTESAKPPFPYLRLFDSVPTKSQKRMLEIAEAAIRNFAKYGFADTSMERIAASAKCTRPLISRYFKDKEEILFFSARVVRVKWQARVVEAMSGRALDPKSQLRAYLKECFGWVNEEHEDALLWLVFFHYCGLSPKFNALNTSLVAEGTRRVEGLIVEGVRAGQFKSENPAKAARDIQVQITGAIVSSLTETLDNPEDFAARSYQTCLDLIR